MSRELESGRDPERGSGTHTKAVAETENRTEKVVAKDTVRRLPRRRQALLPREAADVGVVKVTQFVVEVIVAAAIRRAAEGPVKYAVHLLW